MSTQVILCRTLREVTIIIALFLILTSSLLIADDKKSISALGFVEPHNGITHLSGTTSAIVSELRVGEGDEVKAGEVIALLDNYLILQATVKQVEAEVSILKARLKEVKAGVSKAKIKAQKARVNRFKTEFNTATTKCDRAIILQRKQAISRVEHEDKCLKKRSLKEQLNEAQATLISIAEVRKVTVTVAKTQLIKAKAVLVTSKAELEHAIIRAPIAGRILKIHTKSGERIDAEGIVELGQTASMWVRAEVYETDISKVSLGQQAIITSDAFVGKLQGTVKKVGLLIGKKQVKSVNLSASSDSRVVEVQIKLSDKDSLTVARLTNLQVTVIINARKD